VFRVLPQVRCWRFLQVWEERSHLLVPVAACSREVEIKTPVSETKPVLDSIPENQRVTVGTAAVMFSRVSSFPIVVKLQRCQCVEPGYFKISFCSQIPVVGFIERSLV